MHFNFKKMRTSKLKQDLINKISGITKIGKLEEIMQLLKFQADQSLYVTNEEVKLAIREARDQINKGNFITNETLKNEIQ